VNAEPNWFDGFFEGDYLDEFGADIDEERTRREIDFVAEKLELQPGARLLDVACGHGRHSLELARRGFRVTGVDLSPRSLELAREAAKRESLDIDLVLRDARGLEFDGEFDAAINLFTSVIGYFDDDAETRLVLERVVRGLRPGGSFLVDTINLLGLASRFRPTNWEELKSGTLLLQRHEYDFRNARDSSVWTFVRPDGSRGELRNSVRVYAPHELIEMLENAGLEVVGAWGSFEGAELAFDTWRLILRGDKR
jgi:2-polyprenyl-3-methyl-5-hydroxy-6-metoxy-1,4-benzoquinol methylase